MQSVRLGKGVYITAEYADGQYTLRNSSGAEIGIVAKDDTYRRHDEWHPPRLENCGQWGEWANRQRARFSHRDVKSIRSPSKWKVWANNKAASIRLRQKQANAITRIGTPVDKSQWTWRREWIRSMNGRLSYLLRKNQRTAWDIWAATKNNNWTRKWKGRQRCSE